MKIRVVLVEPKWDINVGSVCRAIRNFRASELVLVNHTAPLGPEAVKFSKHAKNILKNARKVKSIGEAVEGCTIVVGTTGVVKRFGKKSLKKCVSVSELPSKFSKGDRVALLFGNEERGLADKGLQECDLVSFIPTNPNYPVLNLSHAVAVFLYEIYASKPTAGKLLYTPASRKRIAQLEKMFGDFTAQNPAVRNKKTVSTAFKRILRRARPSQEEVQALYPAF
ncbi:TPA: RNA methyltransferase [Candidatus Micrarchaeota archaeon]|nr:RNA methyltransferase [Candidatus Micrarchaeota archaeon]